MAVKHRIRICIGYNQDGSPILKQLGANSEAELGDMAVRAILASERKGEFIQDAPSKIICLPDAKENAAPLLGDYAWTWFRTYKAQNIKPCLLYTSSPAHFSPPRPLRSWCCGNRTQCWLRSSRCTGVC